MNRSWAEADLNKRKYHEKNKINIFAYIGGIVYRDRFVWWTVSVRVIKSIENMSGVYRNWVRRKGLSYSLLRLCFKMQISKDFLPVRSIPARRKESVFRDWTVIPALVLWEPAPLVLCRILFPHTSLKYLIMWWDWSYSLGRWWEGWSVDSYALLDFYRTFCIRFLSHWKGKSSREINILDS